MYARRADDLTAQIETARTDLALIEQQLTTLSQQKALVSDRHKRYKALLTEKHISMDEYNSIRSKLLDIDSEKRGLVRAKVRQKSDIQRLET